MIIKIYTGNAAMSERCSQQTLDWIQETSNQLCQQGMPEGFCDCCVMPKPTFLLVGLSSKEVIAKAICGIYGRMLRLHHQKFLQKPKFIERKDMEYALRQLAKNQRKGYREIKFQT